MSNRSPKLEVESYGQDELGRPTWSVFDEAGIHSTFYGPDAKQRAETYAAATAMEALLRLAVLGCFHIDAIDEKWCFNGEEWMERYLPPDHDWNRVCQEIGWERIRRALGEEA